MSSQFAQVDRRVCVRTTRGARTVAHGSAATRALALACVLALTLLLAAVVPGAALAMTRDEVLRRAQVWVDARVPYSQARWAREDGSLLSESVKGYRTLGYRTDCSGFVSMSLGLTTTQGVRLSLDTSALPTRLKKISKSQLKPGDIILRPRTLAIDGKQVPYGHAAVFVRWTDASKTSYVAYQQSSARKGAVASEVRYPFNGLPGFSAYRYKGIVEGRLRRSITWESPLDPEAAQVQGESALSTEAASSVQVP